MEKNKLLNFSLKNNYLINKFSNRKEKIKEIWKNNSKLKSFSFKSRNTSKNNSIFNFSISKLQIIKKHKSTTKNKALKKRFKPISELLEKLKIYASTKYFKENYLLKARSVLSKKNKIRIFDLNILDDIFKIKNFYKVKNFLKKYSINNSPRRDYKKDIIVNEFLGISYVDNILTATHLQRQNNRNIIKDIVNINIPGDLIGDFKVEKVPEVKRIIDDISNIFGLNNPPIIVLLSSSFFITRSFSNNDLVVFSEEDPKILSKSPYLPDNTLIQSKRVNGDAKSCYHRVIYANKEHIDSWINVISLSGSKIATVTCGAIHLAENLISNSEEISILCDIGNNSTTVYLTRKDCELISTRLPFGSSIYITNKVSLNNELFSRLDKSVKKILKDNNIHFDGDFYINGNGIDRMLSLNTYIKKGFLKIPENNYKVESSKDLDLKLNHSILNSFACILDNITK
ncbi:MAG: hypothetical protein JJ841_007420 [Prochlorococcus marinus CUG1432]|nr:hypothetical protein [Prochlorococcus marinus CUG1432]